MSVIIGSARIDEHGHATGGQAGDQTGKEVSMQDFYVPSKGWNVVRFKNSSNASKAAKAMKQACNNKNIGYDQSNRYGVIKHGTDSKVKTEADCSSLVRECVKEATGKDPGDFNTESEVKALEKTGLFEKVFPYTSKTKLYTGDILVTKTKGHTAIVVAGETRDNGVKVAEHTLRRGDKGTQVGILQKNLIALGYRGKDGKVLLVDDEFGKNTEYALKMFQKAKKLESDGIYGPASEEAMKKALK